LTSKYPNRYQAAVLRNPVVGVASMPLGGSDIPDWAFAEPGLAYDPLCTPICITPAQFQRMTEVSPIHQVDQVRCATLVLISLADLRVSPNQGKSWYHGLVAAGKAKVACKTYKGEIHALDGVEAQRQAFLATLDWYAQVEEER
jgi:acylaminoacyl-peptidase